YVVTHTTARLTSRPHRRYDRTRRTAPTATSASPMSRVAVPTTESTVQPTSSTYGAVMPPPTAHANPPNAIRATGPDRPSLPTSTTVRWVHATIARTRRTTHTSEPSR